MPRTDAAVSTLFSDEQLALLVHDLNNGLTVAQAGVEFAADENGDLPPDTRHALSDAQIALERMRVMLQQFLDTYNLEENGVSVVRRPAVLGDVIEQAARVVGNARPFALEVEAERVACRIDLGLVDRAVANLLLNAVRYVGNGGRIRLSARVDAGDVVIDVGNSGPPPRAESVPTLFDKFVVGDSGQHGLGLYFCQLVAVAHGGAASFHPLDELPTNFRIRFPAQ